MKPSSRGSRSESTLKITGEDGIRPRNRRLISTGEQELVTTSGTSTPGGSRGVSPIPQRYPSRMVSGESSKKVLPVGGLLAPPGGVNNEAGNGGRGSPVGILGGWGIGSWSSWQGLANSVLGGTLDGNLLSTTTGTGKGKSWGVENLPKKDDGGIGAGTTAEREATVRRRKMRRVLEGRDDSPEKVDTNGNYKHRTSMDEPRPGSSQEDAGDAMVYIHHVQPNDTLAGVVLRYNCQPAVFRKANRFWPNDSIQVRKTVVLPVDACAIRGRPCEPPSQDYQGVDLLAPTPGIEEAPSLSNGTGTWPSGKFDTQTSAERLPNSEEGDIPWIHVRWVLLDSSPHSKPVEIARMPRKTLGYFPPRRRKSQSLTTSSLTSTPRASSDLPVLDPIRTNTPTRRTSGLGPKPSVTSVPGSYFPPPAMTLPAPSTRPRRESLDGYAWMSGPGGVGTLGKNVRTPGPGKDSMNSWVKKHLPGIAIDSLPSTSIQGGEIAHFGFSDEMMPSISEAGQGVASPVGGGSKVSTPLLGPNGLGIENAAAAVEGWIRRLGGPNAGTGVGGREVDLIELLDGGGSDDGRVVGVVGEGSGREDLEGAVRGRRRGKSGKSD